MELPQPSGTEGSGWNQRCSRRRSFNSPRTTTSLVLVDTTGRRLNMGQFSLSEPALSRIKEHLGDVIVPPFATKVLDLAGETQGNT